MRTETAKDYWAKSVLIGAGPEVVYAWERRERGGRVFVKYSAPGRKRRDRRIKHKLEGDLTVRDAKGRVDARKEREVLDAVHALAAKLQLGQPPRSTAPATVEDTHDLTLREGFDAFLDCATGKFATKTRRWDEVRRARLKLERILGPDIVWTAINPGHARKVWRELADRAKRSKGTERGAGARQAEVTVDAMYAVASFLRLDGRIAHHAAMPVKGWRGQLFEDWERIVGAVPEVKRLRHTPEEMRRLFANLHDPRVDPRFSGAFDLGGEQRIGQVLRCWRSDLDLTLVAHDAIATAVPGTLGLLRVKSVGRKKASPIMLTGSQRVTVDAALAGYLSHWENAFRAGEVEDYPLFPAGRFKKGKSKVVPKPQPLSRDAALGMFKELEAVAEVESVPGRGWYGVRRIATDLAEDVTKDERVLNSITGHKESSTRRLYQEAQRLDILRRAAETREKVRRGDGPMPERRAEGTTA